jgi:hypothetical protein
MENIILKTNLTADYVWTEYYFRVHKLEITHNVDFNGNLVI